MVVQVSSSTYEERTQVLAQQLLAATKPERSFLGQMWEQMRWDDRLLNWAMESERLRVPLFRLIDVLPSLRTKAEVARHLQEYLGQANVDLPSLLKNLVNFSQPDSLPGQLAASTLTSAVETLAHRYIAGATLKQVSKTVEGLHKQNMAFTLDLLGEAVITETEAEAYLQKYLETMTFLAEEAQGWSAVSGLDATAEGIPLPRVQVSVKLTAFYSQFDPLNERGSQERVSERIRRLLRRAAELGVAVHFDMEQYTYKSLTLSILKDLFCEEEFRHRADIGITLQAYLRDSYQDLVDLINWAKQRQTPITVRLVKGAYWDQETIIALQKHWPQPVFNQKAVTDANFERMTQLLLENHDLLYAAIGSHNIRSQAKALAIAEALKVPKRAFEMQVLYGMADRLATALAQTGQRVRVYCPYGDLLPGMAYLIRRLLENTANSSFLRQSVVGIPAEALLAPPSAIENKPLQYPQQGFAAVPDTDFSDPDQREPFFVALERVRQKLGLTYWPLINGKFIQTEDLLDSVNPSHSIELVGRVGLVNIDHAQDAVQAAQAASLSWRRTPVPQRAQLIRKVADLVQERRQDLAAWMVLEVGKPLRQVDGEISEAIDFCRYYADEMERLSLPRHRDVAGETNFYRYRPRGVAVVISPWNFPLSIPLGMSAAALVTGNSVILKPAEQSSVVACKLAEIMVDAGIPAGVFQLLPGVGEIIGPFLVNHPQVSLIAFTGSQNVGCEIFAEAAVLRPHQTHLKRVIAEMGGKNALIIDASADLDQAVKGVVTSAFGYSGQKCSACSRVIVVEAIYSLVLERLVEAVKSLAVGLAEHPATQVGPVIDGEARDRIQATIDKAKAETPVALEVTSPEGGYFIGPVIFADADPQSPLAQEEIFGPVLAVIRVPDFAEALRVANSTVYGLTGGLYSRTPSHIEQAIAEFEVGNLYINRDITGALVDRQPFGGLKLSGVGSKAGGPDYLLQFMEPQTVTENIQRQGFAPLEDLD